MGSAMHRHDISDHAWSLLAPLLPEDVALGVGEPKTIAFLPMQSFDLRTGAPWRETFHRIWLEKCSSSFCRWRDKGTWEHVRNLMDMRILMADN